MNKKYFLVFLVFLCFIVSGFGQTPWINEIHYDNNGSDVAEGVEVAVPVGYTCAGNLDIHVYNGSVGDVYGTRLNIISSNDGTSTSSGITYIWLSIGVLQNGDPDGIALSCNGTLIQFLSYEGSFTAISGPANGMISTDIGVSESSSTAVGQSLQLQGSGCDYSDFSWGIDTSSIASINSGQTIISCSSPVINVSQASITGLNYVIGNGPSTAQFYQVSGNNLTPANGIITVTAPTNFSISKTVGGTYTNVLTYSYTGGTLSAQTVFVKLNAGLPLGTYGPVDISNSGGGATTQNVSVEGMVTGSNNSDILAVGGSESPNISSLISNPSPLTVAQGVQVWQFKVRDGGASLNDSDNLPTILTDFTLAQNAGNQIGTWSDAIETIALFDGSTRLADGTVTANQIQFTGLNVSVTDNTEKTLSLRLSLKCPLGTDAFDGEDFVFSLSNANTMFSSSGSGKTNFPAQTSTNNQNRIQVVATKLIFTVQPVTTGVNSPMPDVIISATDICGNIDIDFSGSVTLTSTGTLTGSPLNVNAISGEAIFSNMVHTVVGTNFTMNGASTGLTTSISSPFDITNTTTLNKGDLAILSVNVNIGDGYGSDEIAFVSFQDILPGTTIYITDNGYEREFAGVWGGTEGVVSIQRIGTTLSKGTIIVFRSNNGNTFNASHFDIYTCGAIDNNWEKAVIPGGSGFNLNSNDDIWILQGGTWTNDTGHNSTYDGNVLYGWTESGWDTTPGGGLESTAWSTIYPGLECFNTIAPIGPGFVKFNDPINPDFSTTTNGRLDWIALINDTSNWDTYADNTAYNSGGYDYLGNTSCPQMTIAATGYINGKWAGRVDTNWFNCLNWDTLVVPDETVDVQVEDNTFNNHANVDVTASFASYYGNIAKTKNLTITGEKVEVSTNPNNKLEVHGDLLIDAAGALDMDDGNTLSADGELYLYGNWTNNLGPNAFYEGNGTVVFTGAVDQTINVAIPLPPPTYSTEEFYNVILNNNFSTSISNDLLMNGNLTVNTGNTVVVAADDYVHVHSNLTNNGTFNILNNGSLVQVDDSGVNIGIINMERKASVDNLDYVYWSSPVSNFSINNVSTTQYIYKWNPTFANINGTQGNWISASGDNMQEGIGYIVRGFGSQSAPVSPGDLNFTVNFSNVPLNGLKQVTVSKGSLSGVDDNWNLVGNPYPSAVDVFAFLDHSVNSVLDGFVHFWTHGNDPSPLVVDPFYADFGSNYTATDYIAYNASGAGNGPGNISIASGQSFMVNLLEGAPASTVIEFNNSMRNKSYDNSQFYRTIEHNYSTAERHRIWLDLVSETQETNRILVGYVEGATMERDRMYDAITSVTYEQQLYSLINETPFVIQGRSLPFNNTDAIALGINIVAQGNYHIAIAYIDGLFETDNQTIYIKDNLLGFIHNLNEAPYSFASDAGEFNDRFELVFRDSFLSINEEELLVNSVSIIELQNGDVQFKVPSQYEINSIEIIDLLGRTVYNLNGNSNSEIYSLSNLSQATYIAKISLRDGQVISKKAVKRK